MTPQQAKPKSLRDTVDDIVDRWRDGAPPNAESAFAEMPELLQHHSLAIDLAYEEYCLRQESGEVIDTQQFCNKYSRLRHSLGRMLKLHDLMQGQGLMQSQSLGLAAEKSVEWPAVGQPWLDWMLLEEIGRGAFSRVFLATEPSLGNRRVVVKASISGPSEAYLLGKFSHPNVMPVHSIRSDEAQGLVGICMPLLGRVTFAQVLDRVANSHPEAISPRVFSPEYGGWPDHIPDVIASERRKYSLEVVRKIERVARGLEAAHELKVLHGDIKPSNILLSDEGEPLLVDFNLSVAQPTSSETMPQQRIGGTPPYMAPERLSLLTLEGLKAAANPVPDQQPEYRGDVFSLGVVLFELLYGEAPYELHWDDLNAHYEPAREGRLVGDADVARQPVSAELAAVVRRAIALNPAERFGSVKEMADSLQQIVTLQAHRERSAQRRKLLGFLAGGIAGAGLAIWAGTPAKMWRAEYWEVERIIKLIEAGKFMAASERLEALDEANPRREYKVWRAYCSAKLEQISNAEYLYGLTEPDLDRSGITWYGIGLCRSLRGAEPEALLAFNKAIEISPELKDAYRHRAVLQLKISRSRKSAPPLSTYEDIRVASENERQDAHLLFDIAHVYADGSKHYAFLKPRAESYIRQALQQGISPDTFKKTSAFAKFKIDQLAPTPLPPPATKRVKTDDFLPPAHDLRAIFE